jgi:hypothetical protein
VKSTTPFLAVCRCPYCGDSKNNLYKTRGYFFQKGSVRFFCHNCGISRSLSKLLGELDYILKKEYDLEVFTEKNPKPIQAKEAKPEEETDSNIFLKKIKKISQLHPDHPAKLYVVKRKIPFNQHFRLYYSPKFFAWVNCIIPNKFKVKKDEPRLIIPFFDQNKQMFGFQGRSFDPNAKTRYYTIMFREHSKVFGLDQVDLNNRVYVVEGPIDSLFSPNSLAMAGADVDSSILKKENTTIIFDNEPRNVEILKRMKKYIDSGYTVCIWPENINQKDINDMVLSGMDINNLLDVINENSYNELKAELRFSAWRKNDLS